MQRIIKMKNISTHFKDNELNAGIVVCLLAAAFILLLIGSAGADGLSELYSKSDYEEIDEYFATEDSEFNFSFTEYMEKVLYGEEDFSITSIIKSIFISCISSVDSELTYCSLVLLITALAAFLTPLFGLAKNGQVGEMSFYVIYITLIGMLAGLYASIYDMTLNIVEAVFEFMEVLTPAYAMGIAFSTGTATATVMQGICVYVMSLGEGMILKLLLPIVNIYLCITIANHVTKNPMFTKMTELIRSIIKWMNKTMMALVAGMSTIQSLITPGIDEMKRELATGLAGTIPVIGNAISGVAEVVLGAGMVLKNVIGVVGVIAILVLCGAPLFKIWISQLLLKLAAAVMEPIAEKRITKVIFDTAEGLQLLLETATTAAVMFIIVIVILAVGTGI